MSSKSIQPKSAQKHEDYLYQIRHSTAHVMAYAVQQMFEYDDVRLAIGPPIENEFYYDMELPRPITPDDLIEIEKLMKKIIKEKISFVQEDWSFEQAREWFAERDQKFKLELNIFE